MLSGIPMLGKLKVFLGFPWPSPISHPGSDDVMSCATYTAQCHDMCLHVLQTDWANLL